jgi:hypothetical protein
MNKTALFLVVLAGSTASASALAQSASLRGAGLLALNTTESRASGNTVVEMIDSGGGSTGARALRGSDAAPQASRSAVDNGAQVPDPLPEKLIDNGDPAAPAAATPKRPTYRWQSLVPGAIK